MMEYNPDLGYNPQRYFWAVELPATRLECFLREVEVPTGKKDEHGNPILDKVPEQWLRCHLCEKKCELQPFGFGACGARLKHNEKKIWMETWQYDPFIGFEVPLKYVPLSEATAIAWLPFTIAHTQLILKGSWNTRIPVLTIPTEHLRPIKIELKDGQRPIIFRRQYVDMHYLRGVKRRRTMYCIGYQETIQGRNSKVIIGITDNGNVIVNPHQIVSTPNMPNIQAEGEEAESE